MKSALSYFCLIAWSLVFNPIPAQQVVSFKAPDQSGQKMAVQGKLKATLLYGYLKDNPEAESLRERKEFNYQGNPVLVYVFSPKGGLSQKEEYKYDPSGLKIIEAYQEKLTQEGDFEESLFYRFDLSGNLLEYKRDSKEEGFYGLGISYDEKGRVLIKQYFEKDRLPGSSETYGYDNKGNCTSVTKRDIAGDVELLIQSEYDEKGRISKETHKYLGNVLLYSYHYHYDLKGNLIRKEKVGRNEEIGAWEAFKYDAKGRVVEHQIQEQGEPKPIIEKSKYNVEGTLAELKVYDTDGSLFQWFKYYRDSTGKGVGYERLHADGSVSMEDITIYDADGRKLEHRTTYRDGSGAAKIEYRYDGLGLPMEEKHTETGQEQAVYWFVHERY